MLLEVDTREIHIIEKLKALKSDLTFSVVPLDVGDFRFSHEDNVLVVIERKTINDLSHSIKDGRYCDQKYRMCDVYDRSKLMYIIEGNVFSSSCVSDSVKGAIINTLIRDNIKIVPLQNINETIEMICEMYSRFEKNPQKYISVGQSSTIQNLPHHSRKIYLTKEGFLSNVLCQIPGVSTTIANRISDNYSNNLSTFVSTATQEDIEVLKLKSGRKIGDKLATLIISFVQKK